MKAAAHVRANVTGDGVVLLDVEQGSIYSANLVGARIWQLLEEGLGESAIADRIAAECSVPRATVDQDVRDFIASLRDRALVTEAPQP